MKNAIKEYIDFTQDDKKQLWDTATFVFDTNVYLNLYRYSRKTRKVLLKAMQHFKDRVWMPHQVALEFMRRRPGIIFESSERYDSMTNKVCADFFKQCKENLRLSDNDTTFIQLQDYINDWLQKHKTENVEVTTYSDDSILDELLAIYESKTGSPFSDKELESIKNEGKKRYEANIPPGYKDAKKSKDGFDNNAFGDLIVWKQILNYAKTQSKSIIFVTHDQKEDWWEKPHGKTIGPRYELRKEFLDYVGNDLKFHMYTMEGFISYYDSSDRSVVDEVKSYSTDHHKYVYRDGKKFVVVNPDRLRKQPISLDVRHRMTELYIQRKTLLDKLAAIREEYPDKKEIPIDTQIQLFTLKSQVNSVDSELSTLQSMFSQKDEYTPTEE